MKEKIVKKILAYPLSYAQQRIWFLSQLEAGALSYNIGSLIVIKEELDMQTMQSVFDDLIKKHEVLRTNFFLSEEDQPVQVVRDSMKNKLVFYDLSRETSKSKMRKKIISDYSYYDFDLSRDSLARVCLIKLGDKRYELFTVMHHIISDIWSLAIFCNDFFNLYNQRKNKSKHHGFTINQNSVQYKDFAVWERSRDSEKKILAQEKYWLERFSGELPILDLPTDRPRSWTQTYQTKSETVKFDETKTKSINHLCKKYNVTNYVLLLAVYKITLYKISNQHDLVVGTFSANRDLPELDGVMGVFLNNLAIRSQINSAESFPKYLQQLQEVVLSAMDNKEYPFERLIEKINPERDMSRVPIFNTVFQMFSNDERLKVNFYGITGNKDFGFDNGMSQFDLTLKVFAGDKKTELILDYNSWLFKKSSAQNFFYYYVRVLDQLIDQPSILLSDIEIISEKEKDKILSFSRNFNNKKFKQNNLISLFEEQVKSNPDSIALEFYDCKLSYEGLNEKVNQTARFLSSRGVKQGELVGVTLKRTENLIITILAILKIGAAYFPLDIEQPEKRLSFILNKAKARFIIKEIGAKKLKNILNIVLDQAEIEVLEKKDLRIAIKSSDLAYVIFTSGSSGEPKGVKISHSALLNFTYGIKEALGIKKNQKVLATTNLSFDIFFLESIASLCWSLTVVLVDEKERLDPGLLKKMILDKKIEIVQFTPSYLDVLLEDKKNNKWLKGIKKLLIGGETLSEDLFLRIKRCFKNQIFNMYGPTETTVWSSVADLTREKKVSIGRPILNTQIYILDNDLRTRPFNTIGEIYISGHGLASGYLDRKQSEMAFVNNPFIPSQRMYRTGDLGRWLSNGKLECLGRIDNQVKISGRRVELGEIEFQLKKLFNLRLCMIKLVLDDRGEEKMVAYYSALKEIDDNNFRKALEKKLPAYMIPSTFFYLDKFPLNSSGKIDKNALPIPDFKNLNNSLGRLPKNLLEKKLCQIWQDILGINNIGVNDNFFHLGGQSLKLIQVYNRLENEYPSKINLAQLFSFPTISCLAEYLGGEEQVNYTKTQNYKRKAVSLIDRVQQGEISAAEAAKIFASIE